MNSQIVKVHQKWTYVLIQSSLALWGPKTGSRLSKVDICFHTIKFALAGTQNGIKFGPLRGTQVKLIVVVFSFLDLLWTIDNWINSGPGV